VFLQTNHNGPNDHSRNEHKQHKNHVIKSLNILEQYCTKQHFMDTLNTCKHFLVLFICFVFFAPPSLTLPFLSPSFPTFSHFFLGPGGGRGTSPSAPPPFGMLRSRVILWNFYIFSRNYLWLLVPPSSQSPLVYQEYIETRNRVNYVDGFVHTVTAPRFKWISVPKKKKTWQSVEIS